MQAGDSERDMFEAELKILHRAAMRCQHACRLYGTCVKDGKLALVMKLCAPPRPSQPHALPLASHRTWPS